MKPYDVGLICGRFQTYHIGHESLINMGMQLCDRILILIGSAQECGTERNPLNINTRTKMLKEIYGDSPNIMIYGLADMTDENDIRPEWGKYLLGNVDRYVYKVPELMITGNDEERNRSVFGRSLRYITCHMGRKEIRWSVVYNKKSSKSRKANNLLSESNFRL